ncbi:hypothetical protein CCHL11_08010 [Colletotrichum chlorophyti]|uniref:Alpha-ketoglutarate-dependent sulfonate dioxygenase n=1 Tax=Colletotrichum chlorophyti TaxID=708187 RepID=A0A1Q8RM83_9PEZI|nr:hypothetical protein CCHL11_08010 [Colletotrichum chlorophyti]
MPSIFKRSKTKEKEAEEEKAKAERPATPPPTYEDAQAEPPPFEDQPPPFEARDGTGSKRPYTEQDVENVTAAFASLKFGTQNDPDVDSCLAHLKLLYAIQTLKEEIGYTDGLWDLWDTRAGPNPSSDEGSSTNSDDHVKAILAKLREKRWAVFLARAVDRYETWWKTLSSERLREDQMGGSDKFADKYVGFAEGSEDFPWTRDNLPPLDVLMVWHAHMLNPRAFLEDSMRWGLRTFWTTGMPWAQVNEAIDSKFNYEVSDLAKSNWEKATSRAWNNVDEPMAKLLECPGCKETAEVPWTTCGLNELYKGSDRPGLHGTGYGDGDFSQLCTAGCNTLITFRLLCVAKVVGDTEQYLRENYTLPSTVLDPKTGMPAVAEKQLKEVTFPNKLIGQGISEKIQWLIKPGVQNTVTMGMVRDLVEIALSDGETFAGTRGTPVPLNKKDKDKVIKGLTRTERFQTRKMMSRYWENHSIFALDLIGATVRQGVFVDKMYTIDWLHSPNARSTMDRLLQKYHRFMLIMTENPFSLCVPTLDVDLGWHTHQLAPKAYYQFCIFNTATKGTKEARFIDHNDKVDEHKLSNSFEWTSKVYLDKFNEVYSECTCWYCETIDRFDESPPSAACDTSSSAHVSAHNASHSLETPAMSRARTQTRLIWKIRLDDAYERAVKRASKRGKKLPPRELYYNNWGSTYHMYGPCMYPAYLTTGVYAGGDPAFLNGNWANCASGSCGPNDIAAGGCGGPGGCTNLDGYWAGTVRPAGGCAGSTAYAMGAGAGGCGGGGGGCGGGGGS